MKNTKKLLSLLLVFVMTITLTNGFVAKAAETITVTLRLEQDQTTLTKPVQITMTPDDVKAYGDLKLPTDTMTPLHVLAKYLITQKGATEENLSNYIVFNKGFLSGISVNGTAKTDFGSASSDPKVKDAYWMFAVNDTSPVNPATGYGYTMNEYPMQDKDSLVLYGVWGGDYVNAVSPYYTTFAQENYQAETNQTFNIKLIGFDIFNDYGVKANHAMKGAHIVITDASGKQMEKEYVTDENGVASLSLDTAGTYTLTAYRKTTDDAHFDISRPYATVTVADAAAPTPTATAVPTASATPTASAAPTASAVPTPTASAVPTASATPTASAVPTPTASAVPTASAAPTASAVPTATASAVPTASAAPTASAVPTATATVIPILLSDVNPQTVTDKKTAPAKVKQIKATVQKTKKRKKTITLTWKKVNNATGYQVYLSKKKNKGFKKAADTTKTKAAIRKKKGTYYIKIRAYVKQADKTKTTGAFSKPKKIRVK